MPSKIIITTPIAHLDGVFEILASCHDSVTVYIPDPLLEDLIANSDATVIFTNPNKSRIFYSADVLSIFHNLEVFCTASTGTNHVDKHYLLDNGITLLSLTNERAIINSITSTAEHAFALMLSALRNIPAAYNSVLDGHWNYEPYIGRQLNHQSVGIVGYGRLGNYFAQFLRPFNCSISVYDPYKDIPSTYIQQVSSLADLFRACNIISLHVHVSEETIGMIDSTILQTASCDLLLVNTSRSDIVNETHLAKFLAANPLAKYATDVLSTEFSSLHSSDSPLLKETIQGDQLIITPHIAGMTREGQAIAFKHAANILKSYLES